MGEQEAAQNHAVHVMSALCFRVFARAFERRLLAAVGKPGINLLNRRLR